MFDRLDELVVRLTIGTRPGAALVNTMLDGATEAVAKFENRPVIHSDPDAHYRWPGWLSLIHNATLIRSMPGHTKLGTPSGFFSPSGPVRRVRTWQSGIGHNRCSGIRGCHCSHHEAWRAIAALEGEVRQKSLLHRC